MGSLIDIHCHILPGVDDGPKSHEESLEMLSIAQRDGISVIVATPHFKDGACFRSLDELARTIDQLREKVDVPQIHPGADVEISKGLIKGLKDGVIPLINNRRYLLLELPAFSIPPLEYLSNLFFKLRHMDVLPVITHPERNAIFLDNIASLEKIVSAGAYLQVTAMSITGEFGGGIREFTNKLFKRDLVHVVATDAHDSQKRPPILSCAYEHIRKSFRDDVARKVFMVNPTNMVNGDDI
jgi:protein-tyrosine phosphatase